MVGKVRLRFDALETNLPGAREVRRSYPDGGVPLAKAEEWGRFEFGSTLVLLAAPGAIALEPRAPGTPVRLGERIGRLALARA
jgi:phosphatidylserine decarboxylase